MAKLEDVFLENLKETLKGAPRYFLSGSVSALFILLLADRGQLTAGAVEQEVKVPFFDLSATQFGAAFIALAIYILSGWMIISIVKHVEQIKAKLIQLQAKDLLDAGLTYPSMLTTGKVIPVLATLLVAALGTLALLAAFYANQGFKGPFLAGLLCSHSYFIAAFFLWRSPLCEPSGISPSVKTAK